MELAVNWRATEFNSATLQPHYDALFSYSAAARSIRWLAPPRLTLPEVCRL